MPGPTSAYQGARSAFSVVMAGVSIRKAAMSGAISIGKSAPNTSRPRHPKVGMTVAAHMLATIMPPPMAADISTGMAAR